MDIWGSRRLLGLLTGFLGGLAGCTAPGGPGSSADFDWTGINRPGQNKDGGGIDAPANPDGLTAVVVSAVCAAARSSERLPPRLAVVAVPSSDPSAGAPTPSPASTERVVFAQDLFALFNTYCGGCHVDGNQGSFHVSPNSFSHDMDEMTIMGVLKSDSPNLPVPFMPPAVAGGKPFSQRPDDPEKDPIVDLTAQLQVWFSKGKPSGAYTVAVMAPPAQTPPPDPSAGMPAQMASYLVSPAVADTMTNIGNCVADRSMYASVPPVVMDSLDQMFAQADKLPINLADTDLVSLDSAVLIERGVVEFVPTYPLFSDGSSKMRAVRVPRGQSIKFNKATQQFDIPPNTRFYKTFLKKIVDLDGTERYRKIETRLIVARSDKEMPDGSHQPMALFGTYAWSDDEQSAILVQDPLRDLTPFKDRMITYITDEAAAKAFLDENKASANPIDPGFGLQDKGLLRHYAIPGSQRCVECHMGSPSRSFVLGFTPLQVNRRPPDTVGLYEIPGPDELTQLQRLIDYGVITGISSASDILPLESPQATPSGAPRMPRNAYEINAQAYMLGNCAHCHNPRGFASFKQPLLVDVLNFLPTTDPDVKGGIFQFPLDKFSPIRFRGSDHALPIPYITPSLFDDKMALHNTATYTPKCNGDCSTENPWCGPTNSDKDCVKAPWRSLIYRNVDTPGIYAEDFTVFPHMPRNSAGFDCRAPRIMAEWMVSIPSRWVVPQGAPDAGSVAEQQDPTPQPYVEVLPGDPAFETAQKRAALQIEAYHKGSRYTYCPDTTDIVTPGAELAPHDTYIPDPNDSSKWLMIEDGVPNTPNWVVSDFTDSPVVDGDWGPRRADWNQILVNPRPQTSMTANFVDVPTVLNHVTIDDPIRAMVDVDVPLGLWKVKPACNFDGRRKVADFNNAGQPSWRWLTTTKADPSAPVYVVKPGEGVFNEICINCHGPNADAKGLLAEAVSEMTGGNSRVANFKDGLLGPSDHPNTHWKNVFGNTAVIGTAPSPTAEDWAGRYVAWMALGGTQRLIPQAILDIVSATPVLGQNRTGFTVNGTPNMLQTARELCKLTLPFNSVTSSSISFSDLVKNAADGSKYVDWSAFPGLITNNGDAEMWARICNTSNPVVRAVGWDSSKKALALMGIESFYWVTNDKYPNERSYPDDADVMNQIGQIEKGIKPGNLVPMCLKPTDASCAVGPDPCAACPDPSGECKSVQSFYANNKLPWCPASLFVKAPDLKEKWQFRYRGAEDFFDATAWASRGAINAGLAVFLYLQDLETGKRTPQPSYNECEKLTP